MPLLPPGARPGQFDMNRRFDERNVTARDMSVRSELGMASLRHDLSDVGRLPRAGYVFGGRQALPDVGTLRCDLH